MRLISALCCIALIAAGLFGSLVSAAVSNETRITIAQEDEKSIVIKANGREILEYRCLQSPNKPYVRKLFTPGGVQILRDSPGDHKHHHALMFALKADGVDFWSEQPGNGIEKSRSIEGLKSSTQNESGRAGFTQNLDWLDPRGNKPLVEEMRQVESFISPKLDATLISWRTTLEPAADKKSVTLSGDHYFGLGMRFVTSMDEAGEFLYADNKKGEVVRGSEKLTPARWCAYQSKAEGKPVTVAMFDSPENPRHPNKFFTMRPFAYLAATLNLWKEPMTLKTGEPLKLSYGVAVWDGHVDAAEIEKTYQQWVSLERNKEP